MGTRVSRCPRCKKRRRVHDNNAPASMRWGIVGGTMVCPFCVERAATLTRSQP